MATSGDRNRVFASSKFSRSTRETYSGSKAMTLGRAAQPAVEQLALRVGGGRQRLETPSFLRFGAERDRDAYELLAARDEERHLVARLVLLEAVLQAIRAHPEIVDRENLVVHVQA